MGKGCVSLCVYLHVPSVLCADDMPMINLWPDLYAAAAVIDGEGAGCGVRGGAVVRAWFRERLLHFVCTSGAANGSLLLTRYWLLSDAGADNGYEMLSYLWSIFSFRGVKNKHTGPGTKDIRTLQPFFVMVAEKYVELLLKLEAWWIDSAVCLSCLEQMKLQISSSEAYCPDVLVLIIHNQNISAETSAQIKASVNSEHLARQQWLVAFVLKEQWTCRWPVLCWQGPAAARRNAAGTQQEEPGQQPGNHPATDEPNSPHQSVNCCKLEAMKKKRKGDDNYLSSGPESLM